MSAHNQLQEEYTKKSLGGNLLKDPGSGGTVDLEGIDGGMVVLVGNGDRLLPTATTPLGATVYVTVSSGGPTLNGIAISGGSAVVLAVYCHFGWRYIFGTDNS